MDRVVTYLKKNASPEPSRWKEEVEWRRANRGWLRYSQYVAIRMLSKMDELHMTQSALAEKMGCSQQYISKVLKGKENLSLETLWKIESALEIDLVKSALTFVNGYERNNAAGDSRTHYLNDPGNP
ncbi:MAG: helix-turn-helix transcriptional regulator [Bacteroidales bacterium]|nr:helix-turn-helix transcriptional regulator [Bacteroidales bacterium]